MASSKTDWNSDLVSALIEQMHENEILWNTGSLMYKNKNAQEAAWLRISTNIGLEGRPLCAQAKWRDFRDTYRKKLKAIAPKSGDAGGSKKVRWPWMRAMEYSKAFFNIEVPTVSNFRRIGLDHDTDEADGEEETLENIINSTVDPSQLDFVNVSYVDMSVGSNDSLFDQEEESTNLASSSKENGVKSRGESSFQRQTFSQ
eukprot:gene16065-7413_t